LIKPAAPQNAIEEYLSLTEHSLRFSVNFRFNTGSVALDNRALADVNRLAKFIEEEKLEHCNLKLLGFSDKFGSAADNWKISRTRARIVANTIAEKANVNIQEVKGFGHTMPVASNATSQGRLKNRRVEVWISCPSE
ncbi:MAG: OmpA family protein, partial [Fibrobacterota bacterium]